MSTPGQPVSGGAGLVKAPKLYLRDTGLLHHLLNIDSLAVLDSHPHFWRTAAGAEADVLLERSGALHVVEIKTARATLPYLARGLRAIMEDTGATTATVIDQGQGSDPLAPGVARRGFEGSTTWLP